MTFDSILSWLLTYAAHSTLLIAGTWILTRSVTRLSHAARNRLWRAALVGALVTTSVQLALDAGTFDVFRRSAHVSAGTVDASSGSADVTIGWLSPRWTMVLVLTWIFGMAASALRRVRSSLRHFRSLGERAPVDDEQTAALLAELKERAGIQRTVFLTSSQTLHGPVAIGLSEICMPPQADSCLGRDETRAVLAHELAHLVRFDPIWLIVFEIVETLFFFQPLNRLARAYAETEAEYACDLRAVEWTGERAMLARSLANVASRFQTNRPGTVPGMAGWPSTLYDRVDRILNGTHISECNRSRLLSAGIIAMLACSVVLIGPSLSVQPDQWTNDTSNEEVGDGHGPSRPTATPNAPISPAGVQLVSAPRSPSTDPKPPGKRPSGPVSRPVPPPG